MKWVSGSSGAFLSLVNALFFLGYLLVYAGIAHGGRFALRPWDALLPSPKENVSTTAAQSGQGYSSLGGKILSLLKGAAGGVSGAAGSEVSAWESGASDIGKGASQAGSWIARQVGG